MLTEICQYLHNWFDKDQMKYRGRFTITNGIIEYAGGEMDLLDGQHIRIIGSRLNDGVYQYPSSDLKDEVFEGAVWSMAFPPALLALSEQIQAWQDKYGGVDSSAMSPYTSEAFGGYSYSKATGGNNRASANGSGITWQDVFGALLTPWRKLP